MVASVATVRKPPAMEIELWWRPLHRIGHKWIARCNIGLVNGIRERLFGWRGHVARMCHQEPCARALRCVETATVEIEASPVARPWRQMARSTPEKNQHVLMGGSRCEQRWKISWGGLCLARQRIYGMVGLCSRSSAACTMWVQVLPAKITEASWFASAPVLVFNQRAGSDRDLVEHDCGNERRRILNGGIVDSTVPMDVTTTTGTDLQSPMGVLGEFATGGHNREWVLMHAVLYSDLFPCCKGLRVGVQSTGVWPSEHSCGHPFLG